MFIIKCKYKKKFNFWNVRGIINTSGLLQSKGFTEHSKNQIHFLIMTCLFQSPGVMKMFSKLQNGLFQRLVHMYSEKMYVYKKGILGECLLISSLPGKALRTLVDIARLAERFNMRS